MSRRHLESALIAGSLIESGLEPAFRFSRVRFSRTLYPPNYEPFNFDVPKNNAGADPCGDDQRCCECGGACAKPGECVSKTRRNWSDGLTRMPRCKPPLSEDDFAIHSLQFSGDGRTLCAGLANTSVHVIDVTDGRQQLVVRPSKWTLGMPITCLRFMPPNLYWVIGCTPHGEIFCFFPQEEGFETILQEKQETYCLDISPDGLELATAGLDQEIRLYGLYPGSNTGFDKPKCQTRCHVQDAGPISCDKPRDQFPLNNEPQQRLQRRLYTGGRPDQIVHRSSRPYIVNRCYANEYVNPPACEYPEPGGYSDSPGNCVVVPRILSYHPTSPSENYTHGHSKRITALRYHQTKPFILVSAGWDEKVKIWDTRCRCCVVQEIFGPHICSPEGIDIEGDLILTASWRKRQALEIWDLRFLKQCPEGYNINEDLANSDVKNTLRKQPLMKPCESIPVSGIPVWECQPMMDQGEYLYAAKLLPSRAIACGGSGFQELRVVHRDTFLPVVRVMTDSNVNTLDTILEGRYIATGCTSGSITITGMA